MPRNRRRSNRQRRTQTGPTRLTCSTPRLLRGCSARRAAASEPVHASAQQRGESLVGAPLVGARPLLTLDVIVAENRNVCRSRGNTWRRVRAGVSGGGSGHRGAHGGKVREVNRRRGSLQTRASECSQRDRSARWRQRGMTCSLTAAALPLESRPTPFQNPRVTDGRPRPARET